MKYLIFLIGITLTSSFQQSRNGTLIVHSGNFSNNSGKAVLLLFRENDEIPEKPFRTITVNLKEKKAEFQIENLPYGNYAAIIHHDENNNGKIDHSFGIPSEQLGYSNNWQLGFFTGMPSFSKLKFEFSVSNNIETINISYK